MCSEVIPITLALPVFGSLEAWFSHSNQQPRSSWKIAGIAASAATLLIAITQPPTSFDRQLRSYLIFPIIALISWKVVTRNYDYRNADESALSRVALLGLAGLSGMSDAALPAFLLYLGTFDVWTHHLLLPLRLVLVYFSCRLVEVLLGSFTGSGFSLAPGTEAWPLYLIMAVHLSHYVVPGIGKLTIGSKPWSWIMTNKTHLILPAAYAWGWLRFVPERYIWLPSRKLSRFTPIYNSALIILEIGCLVAPGSAQTYLLFCCAFVLFHLFIFLLAGICFWHYAAVNILFGLYLLMSLSSNSHALFGLKATVIVGGLIIFFPVRQVLWKPHNLAWWETPLLNRVRIEVIGRSSARYEIYNNFMCPHEREFGRIPLRFCVDEPILTGHLGQVENERLRELILATEGNSSAINELKKSHGAFLYDPQAVERFSIEMKSLFRSIREGRAVNPLPKLLRHLKAPGGHYYYWGDNPPFTGQEEVVALKVFYIEEFLFSDRRTTLRERMVLNIGL